MYPGYSLLLRQAPCGSPCPVQPENIPASPAPSPCCSTPAPCQLQTGGVISKMTVALAPARLLIMRKADTDSQQTAFAYCRGKQNEGKRKNGLIRENQLEGRSHVVLCKPDTATMLEPKILGKNRLVHRGSRQCSTNVEERWCAAQHLGTLTWRSLSPAWVRAKGTGSDSEPFYGSDSSTQTNVSESPNGAVWRAHRHLAWFTLPL